MFNPCGKPPIVAITSTIQPGHDLKGQSKTVDKTFKWQCTVLFKETQEAKIYGHLVPSDDESFLQLGLFIVKTDKRYKSRKL